MKNNFWLENLLLRVRRNFVRLIFLSIMLSIGISDCSYKSKLEFEKRKFKSEIKSKIINASLTSETEKVVLDISTIVDGKIKKICIQQPYATSMEEEAAGENLEDFYVVWDDAFVLWIFREQKTPIQLEFKRWQELTFANRSFVEDIEGEDVSTPCSTKPILKIFKYRLYLTKE
ncbi:MAG: hypothetical protein QM520_00460 [Gammaproteobacteria bacterium]|nr:hypothetical protein [Gammaproteobacteria bacterium]